MGGPSGGGAASAPQGISTSWRRRAGLLAVAAVLIAVVFTVGLLVEERGEARG